MNLSVLVIVVKMGLPFQEARKICVAAFNEDVQTHDAVSIFYVRIVLKSVTLYQFPAQCQARTGAKLQQLPLGTDKGTPQAYLPPFTRFGKSGLLIDVESDCQ